MGFKLPDSYYEKQKEIFDQKYIDFNGKKIHVSVLKDKSVTSEMKSNMRMNSYAQDDIYPKLTDEALFDVTRYYLNQCTKPRFPCATYDEALIHKIVPELLKRLDDHIQLKERVEVIQDTVGFKL